MTAKDAQDLCLTKQVLLDHIFLDGLADHLAKKFGFEHDKITWMEGSAHYFVFTSISFTVNGIGWCWGLAADDITRAEQYDE